MKPFIISKTSGITGLQNKIDIEFSIVNIMSFNQQSSLAYKEHMTMREILGSIYISKQNIFNLDASFNLHIRPFFECSTTYRFGLQNICQKITE